MSHCQEVAEYIFPIRASFNTERTEGDKRNQKILDSTGSLGHQTLASGMHGMASNPASQWFTIKTDDEELNENDKVRTWLTDVTDRMFARMHSTQSSITTHLHELYLDLAAFGTAVMFIGQTDEEILFQTRFLGECVIDENAEGRVDTVIRSFKMTARQVVQKWGEAASEDTKKFVLDGKLDQKIDLLHAVFPRSDRDERETPDNMPFASIYLERKGEHKLQEGGFEEFPYAVPRWFKAAGEKYGRSPAMTALADVKMLQQMMATTIKAAQKSADPPLLVPHGDVIGPVRTVPGGLTFYRPGSGSMIQPLVTGANFNLSFEMMRDVRQRIASAFYVDQLQFSFDTKMTATEVMQRTEERMRLLGPILGRMESELLGPIITRVFGIMTRAGEFPPQPEELDGVEWRVEYTSPLALAQRSQRVDRAIMMITAAAPVAQFDPGVFARFNSEDFLPWIASTLGVDPELVLDDEEFAAKQQATQMASMAGPAQIAADAFAKVGQGAKAMAEAQEVGRAA